MTDLSEQDTIHSLERFMSKVARDGDCWVWTAGDNGKGYGRFYSGKGMVIAHRWIYEQTRGKVPSGLELDHLCRNRICVRPEHLEAVTHSENMLRVDRTNITSCPSGHPYAERGGIHHGRRYCKECQRLSSARRRAANAINQEVSA